MARSQEDLLAMKSELTNDPKELGLTILPEDDAANADIINAERPECQIHRDDVPSGDIRKKIKREETAGLEATDRWWIDLQLGAGLVDARPNTLVRDGFLGIFQAGTDTRAGFQTLLIRDGTRWEEMVQDGNLTQEGAWTPSEIANARNATE